MKKVCKKCKIEKDLDLFHKRSLSKDGYRNICKECRKGIDNKYYKENPERYKENGLKYRMENHEKVKERSLRYYYDNIEKLKEYGKEYWKNNSEKRKETIKKWATNNTEKIKEKSKRYFEKNKDKINQNKIEKRKENYNEYRKHTNLYVKEKRLNDPLFRIKGNLRSRISSGLKSKGFKKNQNTVKILGCSYVHFKLYLEQQFEPWMNWENYGKYNGELNYGWDIDHVIPQSNGKTVEEIIELNKYTNLKPLCSYINRIIKKNKVDY